MIRVKKMLISLPCVQGRSFTWLGDEEVKYSNWKDGEPNQMAGCGHMTTTGQWTMTPCDAKLDAAICQISGTCASMHEEEEDEEFLSCSLFVLLPTDEPVSHQWVYPGQCPHSVGEWAWVPFRNHCYAFNLQLLRLQQDARTSCSKSTAAAHSADSQTNWRSCISCKHAVRMLIAEEVAEKKQLKCS